RPRRDRELLLDTVDRQRDRDFCWHRGVVWSRPARLRHVLASAQFNVLAPALSHRPKNAVLDKFAILDKLAMKCGVVNAMAVLRTALSGERKREERYGVPFRAKKANHGKQLNQNPARRRRVSNRLEKNCLTAALKSSRVVPKSGKVVFL